METVSVDIEKDEEGYLGRECPECEKYFKIKPGTGIPDVSDCYCPYCKHFAPQDQFWTKPQIEYAKSVIINRVSGDLLKTMKKMEVNSKRNQFLSIGITVKGKATPITHYSEKELEEKVACSNCTLEYTIYGAFGFCPDCAGHNSQQIVLANFELVLKILELAKDSSADIQAKLIENSLEDCISAFDGFARERCSTLYPKLSFQNIKNAKQKIESDSGIDISKGLDDAGWNFVVNQFQKRHLLAHKMGVIDEEYIKRTGIGNDSLGKKVPISEENVMVLIGLLQKIVSNLSAHVQRS